MYAAEITLVRQGIGDAQQAVNKVVNAIEDEAEKVKALHAQVDKLAESVVALKETTRKALDSKLDRADLTTGIKKSNEKIHKKIDEVKNMIANMAVAQPTRYSVAPEPTIVVPEPTRYAVAPEPTSYALAPEPRYALAPEPTRYSVASDQTVPLARFRSDTDLSRYSVASDPTYVYMDYGPEPTRYAAAPEPTRYEMAPEPTRYVSYGDTSTYVSLGDPATYAAVSMEATEYARDAAVSMMGRPSDPFATTGRGPYLYA